MANPQYAYGTPGPISERKRNCVVPAILVAAALPLGAFANYTLNPPPEPEVVVEAKTVTETRTEYILPESCIAALDTANAIISNSGYVLEEINTLFGAAGIMTILVQSSMEQDPVGIAYGSDLLGVFNANVNYYMEGMDLEGYTAFEDSCRNT